MARKKKKTTEPGEDGKSAAAGDTMDPMDQMRSMDTVDYVFDEPFDAQKAVDALCELNHERVRCAQEWEDAKTAAANAKKALDDATNAITLLIDRIDAHQRGELQGQPALRTLNGSDGAEATA